jgi:hypothetical protein
VQADKADCVQVMSAVTGNIELKLKKLLEEEPWKQLRHPHTDHLDDTDFDLRWPEILVSFDSLPRTFKWRVNSFVA